MALTHAPQEGLYLQRLQVEIGLDHEGPGVLLLCDNQSSMKVAQNRVFHKCSKHISIRYYLIWEKVEGGEMELQFARTKAIAADQLIKEVGLQILVARKDVMGMLSGYMLMWPLVIARGIVV